MHLYKNICKWMASKDNKWLVMLIGKITLQLLYESFAECIFPQSILHYFALLYTCKSTSVWMSVINFGEDETSSLKDGVLDLCTSSCCSWALEAWLLAFVILQQSKTKKTIVFCPCLFFCFIAFVSFVSLKQKVMKVFTQ